MENNFFSESIFAHILILYTTIVNKTELYMIERNFNKNKNFKKKLSIVWNIKINIILIIVISIGFTQFIVSEFFTTRSYFVLSINIHALFYISHVKIVEIKILNLHDRLEKFQKTLQ